MRIHHRLLRCLDCDGATKEIRSFLEERFRRIDGLRENKFLLTRGAIYGQPLVIHYDATDATSRGGIVLSPVQSLRSVLVLKLQEP
uniref:Uncharacterized protein n=1 Tax=Peronospora matthiolae TaxID=2874970 RepID=A0AAV1TJE9_9STRA